MTHHVIIGGGPAATNALETLREFDSQAQITLISNEPAHSRMALPYWLAGQIPREHTLTADDDYYRRLNVTARIGERVDKVNPQGKTVQLADGTSIGFDTLLIATGATPLGLSVPGADLPGVQCLWTLDHTTQALASTEAQQRPRVVLIGAGFIGFIVLNAMYKRGWELAVIEREAGVLPRMLNARAATLVEQWLSAKGVALNTGTSVQAIHAGEDGAKRVELANGQQIEADLVVVATGISPNLDLVRDSGIEIDQGILVNDRMQTNYPYIYAAGDVAQGPVLYGDSTAIHAIQPTAIDHGRVAAANMAGHEIRYPGSLAMNVLDVCGLQCASYGNWQDASAEAMTIDNPDMSIYRSLLWHDDALSGAIFVGRSNDLGMLTDVGMVKGILQTHTALGPWKRYLAENPFDIRRPYIALQVARKLANTTLLGQPAKARGFHHHGARPQAATGAAHAVYVANRSG